MQDALPSQKYLSDFLRAVRLRRPFIRRGSLASLAPTDERTTKPTTRQTTPHPFSQLGFAVQIPEGLIPVTQLPPFAHEFSGRANKTNHDYLILNSKERQPLVEQGTVGEITTCTFFAKQMEVDFSIKTPLPEARPVAKTRRYLKS